MLALTIVSTIFLSIIILFVLLCIGDIHFKIGAKGRDKQTLTLFYAILLIFVFILLTLWLLYVRI